MLFKKTPPPAAQATGGYCWPVADAKSQALWISIYEWQYKVFPSRSSRNFGSSMFEFEGSARTAPVEDAIVSGTIEVLAPGESFDGMRDHWSEIPATLEGYTQPIETEPGMRPSICLKLLCQDQSLQMIHQAFLLGATSRSGGLSLNIEVDCPNNSGGEFWFSKWRNEWLRVSSWKLFANSKLRSEA